jgi:hypothetical protein|tara:strand:+ start:187 stop:378 length:192 start_codon:yes stop_codon:yes gene_type:complete
MVKMIKLNAKTKLGKKIIHNHGDTFHVESCPRGKVISSLKSNWGRLVLDNDEHFDVVEEIEVA